VSKELNFFQTETVEADQNSVQVTQSIEELNAAQADLAEDLPQVEAHILQHVKRVLEALLFASNDPITLPKLREIIDAIVPLKPRQIRLMIEELQQDYLAQQRSFRLEEIAQGYVLRTHEAYAPYIEHLYRQKRGEKLSYASTEVLAIIAYRQPVTRPQIDAIRGVDSSGTVAQLLERNLIEPVGKLEAPGRPMLYGTTKDFLKHFGLKDLNHLKNQPAV
jgi:segregation and condensation protein B